MVFRRQKNEPPAIPADGFSMPVEKAILDVLDDLAGLEAFRADFNLQHSTVYLGSHRDEVGKPGSPAMVFRVRNIVAVHCAFAADITYSGHNWTPNEISGRTLAEIEKNVKPSSSCRT
jgi:hypothetical protein